MKKKIAIAVLCFCFLFAAIAQAAPFKATVPTVEDHHYNVKLVINPTSFLGHGTNGCMFDANDNYYVGSVSGASTYKVDTKTGEATLFLGPPNGGADDMVFLADGTVVWNAFFNGEVWKRTPDGKDTLLGTNIAGANAVALNKDGRVFVTQCFFGSALWEIDLSGQQNNRKIWEIPGAGPNGSSFGPDGMLYTPLWFKGQIIKTNVDTGEWSVVAEGIKVPSAVKFNSKGELYTTDTATGNIYRVDINNGQLTLVATLKPHLDNFAFDSKDMMYVTEMSDNAVWEVDVTTGKTRKVTDASVVFPNGLAVAPGPDGKDLLYLADNFNYKKINPYTGEVVVCDNKAAFVDTTTISEDGKYVLMSAWFTGKVQVFDRSNDQMLYAIPGFKQAAGTLMLSDGSVLVAEGTGDIVKVTDKEGKAKTVLADGLQAPTFMAKAADGSAIYVTEYAAGQITKIDLATGAKQVIAKGLQSPKGIALNADGKLIVLEAGTKKLLAIDPANGKKKVIASHLASGANIPVKGFGHPAFAFGQVTISQSGNIYVCADEDNTIYMFSHK